MQQGIATIVISWKNIPFASNFLDNQWCRDPFAISTYHLLSRRDRHFQEVFLWGEGAAVGIVEHAVGVVGQVEVDGDILLYRPPP